MRRLCRPGREHRVGLQHERDGNQDDERYVDGRAPCDWYRRPVYSPIPSASVQEIKDALLADATAGAVNTEDPLTPNRLAFIGPPTLAPKQRLLFSLPVLYLDGGAVQLAAAALFGAAGHVLFAHADDVERARFPATPRAAGTCTIKASQAGTPTYNATSHGLR